MEELNCLHLSLNTFPIYIKSFKNIQKMDLSLYDVGFPQIFLSLLALVGLRFEFQSYNKTNTLLRYIHFYYYVSPFHYSP